MKNNKPILIGETYMRKANKTSTRAIRYGLYECQYCGNYFEAIEANIKSGQTQGCGCQKNKSKITHGNSNSRLYHIWNNMKMRCYNQKDKAYPHYGGRGILVCDTWINNFSAFYDWTMSNGYSDDLTLDRIDNDKGYSAENCRWTTKVIQSRNTRICKNNTSGYRGVSYNKRDNNWVCRIMVDKIRILLGTFSTAREAGIKYNEYVINNNLEHTINKII